MRALAIFSAVLLASSPLFAQAINNGVGNGGAGGGGSGITALTGDVTASGSGSVAATVVGAGGATFTTTAAQTYTFPTTTATLARTDAAQTFTGVQTFPNLQISSSSAVAWSSSRGKITSPATGKIQLGDIDQAAPVAQFLKAQSVVTATANTAGQDWTFQGSAGTGTGAGGKLIFQTAPAGSTGSTPNAQVTQLILDPAVTVAATSVLCTDAANSLTSTCSSATPTLNLINATGLPIATGVSGLGTGVATALATGATGSGNLCLAQNCTMTTPNVGAATATSVNKWVFTAPATSATLVSGADGLTYTFPSSSVTLQAATMPGYISSNWYLPAFVTTAAGGALVATGTVPFLPIIIPRTVTIKGLSVRCTTQAASGNVQLALYANNAATGRPTGAALMSTNSITTGSTGILTPTTPSPATVTLAPGTYWFAIAPDTNAGGTAAFSTAANTGATASWTIGVTTGNLGDLMNASSQSSFYVTTPLTFNNWGDLTSAVWTEVANNKTAIPMFQAN